MFQSHPLREYLDEAGLSLAGFAALTDVPAQLLREALAGESGLSLVQARRISSATDGSVAIKDLMLVENLAEMRVGQRGDSGPNVPLDARRLQKALMEALPRLFDGEVQDPDLTVFAAPGAEAVVHTVDALEQVPSIRQEDLLLLALQLVLREIQSEYPVSSDAQALEARVDEVSNQALHHYLG